MTEHFYIFVHCFTALFLMNMILIVKRQIT